MAVFYEGKYEFPVKKFFWASSNDFKFEEMPETLEQHTEYINKYNDFFSGEPNKILENLEAPAGENEEEEKQEEPAGEDDQENKDLVDTESEDDEVKVPPKNMTELHRLSFVVMAIENDCQVETVFINRYEMFFTNHYIPLFVKKDVGWVKRSNPTNT